MFGRFAHSGELLHIAAMREATKHLKYTVNVTEVFNAVTGRMLAGASDNVAVQGGMISAAALSGSATTETSTAVAEKPKATRPKFKMRTKEVSFQILAGAAQTLLP